MFFRPLLAIFWLTIFSFQSVFAQADSEVWPQCYFQHPINDKWSVSSDYSSRYSGLFQNKVQWIARTGLTYNLNKHFGISAGYAYSEYFSTSGVRRENRPWQQVQSDHSFKGLRFNHRLRLEERFQRERRGDRFNYRLRYQLLASVPVIKDQRLSFYFSGEPMINFGSEITGNMFDQNRAQAGLQIKLAKNVFLTPAYLYTYQYRASKRDFRNINIIRTGIVYSKK